MKQWNEHTDLVPGDHVSIMPVKTNDTAALRALSALDMALVQQHLLGLQPLDSPYKLLAADVDGSGDVTSQDIALMQRRLLGYDQNFPLGTWRFVPACMVFTNPQQPWTAPYCFANTNLVASNTVANFYAMKLGDVDNSWSSGVTNSGQPVTFQFKTMNATPGSRAFPP